MTIKITLFPKQQYNLWDLICTFLNTKFEMTVIWRYTSESELNVKIVVSDALEGTLCAWLSSCGFQFESIEEENDKIYKHRYTVKAIETTQQTGKQIPSTETQTQTSLFVLLTGLLKTDGGPLTICINNTNAQKSLQISIIVETDSDYKPFEIGSAYGDCFILRPENTGKGWFKYNETVHRQVLALPFTGDSANALVSGFGEPRQAVCQQNVQDVVISEIFNDVIHRQLMLTTENLKSSTAVFGSPGYGKSTLVNSLLYQLWSKIGIGFVVVEPAKEEYRMLKRIIPELQVVSDLQKYNPLLPPSGMDSSMYAEVVLQLIDLATETPRDSPLRDYFRETYLRCVNTKNVSPTHVLDTYMALMEEQKFTMRANDFVVSGRHRLQSFFTFFCGANYKQKKLEPFSLFQFLNQKTPIVIELNTIPTPGMKTAFTYWILTHLKAFFQKRKSSDITHILVLEEAHNILGETLNKTLITDVTNIVAENRAKGQTTFIIEQSPNRIDQGATNLCGNTFSFRLTTKGDRDYAASMLDTDSQRLNTLRKHCCLVRTNSMYSSEHIHVEVDSLLLS